MDKISQPGAAARSFPLIEAIRKLCGVLVLFSGCWGLYAQICVYGGMSFNAMYYLAWLPLVAAAVLCFLVFRSKRERQAPPDKKVLDDGFAVESHAAIQAEGLSLPQPGALALVFGLAGASIGAWIVFGSTYIVGWLVAVACLGASWWGFESLPTRSYAAGGLRSPSRGWRRFEICVLLLAVIAAAAATLAVHRPDTDDALYLNKVAATLNYPEKAVLSFDGLHGNPEAPIQQVGHRPQTYELLLAVLTRLLPLSHFSWYYFIFPAVFACFVPLAQLLLVSRFSRRWAVYGAVLATVLLAAWGAGLHEYGSFAFIRLYQGKSVFISVFAPLLIFYAYEFCWRGGWRLWLLVFAAISASMMYASTAAFVAPLAVGVILTAGLIGGYQSPGERMRRFAMGCGAFLHAAIVLGLVYFESRAAGGTASDGYLLNIWDVFGTGVRGLTALGLLLLLPAAAAWRGHPRRRIWLAYVTLWVGVLMTPWVSTFLAENVSLVLSWRIFWALPMPALMAGTLVLGADLPILEKTKWGRYAAPAAAGCVILAFLVSDTWSFAAHTYYRFPIDYKANRHALETARKALQYAGPEDMVLAEETVASILAGYRERPRLLTVRRHFLEHLERYWGDAETAARIRLFEFINGDEVDRGTCLWAAGEVAERDVDMIIIFKGAVLRNDYDPFFQALFRQGYRVQETEYFFFFIHRDLIERNGRIQAG